MCGPAARADATLKMMRLARMMGIKAFVGHSFNEADKELVRTFLDHFRALSKANAGFTWDHAEEAEAAPLSEKVLAKIQDKNVFIGVCTRSEYAIAHAALKPAPFSKTTLKTTVNDAHWKTSDWMIQEIGLAVWPAPGSEDTELGVLMELEVGHGETEVYPRVQA
jgi:hypothetical protein